MLTATAGTLTTTESAKVRKDNLPVRYRAIILFGAPGAGKGTQGKILGTIPRFFHCSCGDVFRSLTIDNELGRTFLEYSSRGELVPDESTVKLWRSYIDGITSSARFDPKRDTMVLDGIPRNLEQARILADTLDVRAVFYLTCPDLTKLIERLQRRALRDNRLDDANLEVIRNRLETYESETKPVLDFYGPKLVHTIDATQAPETVLRDILNHISTI